MPDAIPDAITRHADIERLTAASRRAETACGQGSLVWRIWGSEGSPVVLLHGGSGSWRHWARNIGALVHAGHTVYTPDLPGFGESSLPPVGFDADAHTEWIQSGLNTLFGEAPYDLAGFSFGSMVATFLADQNPAQVQRLILVGAPALSPLPASRVDLRSWRGSTCPADVRDAHRHNLRSLMLAHEESIQDFVIDLYGADAEHDRIPHRRLFKTDILRQTLPTVRCPVWGIWGAQDALHHECMESIRDGLSRAPLFQTLTTIPRAGHWVQFEEPQRFNQELRKILDTNVST
ncbi:MAG TPA: alpha/beta hydrolase [Burkholderiaceae bacterium]|nr:alpha/beta hydrolase [Burkholderiaceae bacterium]